MPENIAVSFPEQLKPVLSYECDTHENNIAKACGNVDLDKEKMGNYKVEHQGKRGKSRGSRYGYLSRFANCSECEGIRVRRGRL